MTSNVQFNLLTVFLIIFLYLMIRILVNTKFNKFDIVKELYLIGLITSILFIFSISLSGVSSMKFKDILIFIPLGYFSYYCFEGNMRDSLLMCLLITLILKGIQLYHQIPVNSINDILLSLLGGFIGILFSYKFVKKTQLRF